MQAVLSGDGAAFKHPVVLKRRREGKFHVITAGFLPVTNVDDVPMAASFVATVRTVRQQAAEGFHILLSSLNMCERRLLEGGDQSSYERMFSMPVDIAFDNFDLHQFTEAAANFGSAEYGYVVTPNVDHMIRYYDDASFRKLYADAHSCCSTAVFWLTCLAAYGV